MFIASRCDFTSDPTKTSLTTLSVNNASDGITVDQIVSRANVRFVSTKSMLFMHITVLTIFETLSNVKTGGFLRDLDLLYHDTAHGGVRIPPQCQSCREEADQRQHPV